ncbi:GNAT family N-acetyltransferase [Pseudogemmobacter sonorensis]|uniref:GNAT family N-acetyltransferase n=1 Tax=Pseudogemmobacter sonorensis TaxID=2989681 RepID=UPI0036BC9B9F
MHETLPLRTHFGTLRGARTEDAERIVQMVGALARHHGDTPGLTVEALLRDISGTAPWLHLLVAEAGGELAGYAALCGQSRLQFGWRGMDIHHLFTEARFRGRGIGQGLVRAAGIRAAELSCSYLTVGTHPENLRAQAFYESLGFERTAASPPRFSLRLGA